MPARVTEGSQVDASVALYGSSVTIGGVTLTPDETKAVVELRVAKAFPAVTKMGLAMHPQVIANSYRSMFGQMVNLGHLVKRYNPTSIARDRIIGAMGAVEFPETPEGGWKLTTAAAAPQMRCGAFLFKHAEHVADILAAFGQNPKSWNASMEVRYYPEDSGFAIKGQPFEGVTAYHGDDWKALGWHYVAWADAPADLRACFSEKKVVDKPWRGREVVLLQGGLDGTVHFQGAGAVQLPGEPAARIVQMLACDPSVAEAVEDLRKNISSANELLLTP